ncbi:biopolymer transporter ExbD [Rhodobacteraceae bacterium KMM 6894]|nr:biopolymer transporter ExbD [Rhodobacteraceae bacterium KMM 6894]
MQFPDPPRRKATDSIVPMINVVFLLLIFFLMTAQIAPPEPFAVSPPNVTGQGDPAEADLTLYLAANGDLAYGDILGPEAVSTLEQALVQICGADGCAEALPQPLILRADAAVEGAQVARLMTQLAQAGFAQVQLVTVQE